MLVWDDWTWLIHGSVFHHHWSLPVGNIWFFAVKVSLCLSHNSAVFLEEESTPGAGQMPGTAMYDSRAWTIYTIYWWWYEMESQLNENYQLHSVDWWVSTFFLLSLPQILFFKQNFNKMVKNVPVLGETYPPLYSQDNSWGAFSETQVLPRAPRKPLRRPSSWRSSG